MTAKKNILADKAPAPIGPYSQAVMVGETLYVSGQIALDPANGNMAGNNDVELETWQVMRNLAAILKEAGMGWQNVVKASIFLKDLSTFGVVNNIYGFHFKENPPARETVQVAKLPKDANVEISVIAVK